MDFINSIPNAVLISIHQNHFSDEKEWGTQIWYAPGSNESKTRADKILKKIKSTIQQDNNRENKESGDEYYILYNATHPSIMIECGFMSNNEENKKLYQIAADTESICVTVRRGDYVSDNSIQKFVDICSVDYFLEGVQIIRKKLNTNNLSVIVFSDDVDWCRENIRFEGISNVFYESGNDPIWEKIRMMYSCKHFVISNSSFSWWAQYLSRNENKIVVAPSKWRNYENAMDIYESGWILVDVDHISEHKVYERR